MVQVKSNGFKEVRDGTGLALVQGVGSDVYEENLRERYL